MGIGRYLLKRAEDIAASKGFHTIAVIAGEGTKRYYEKLGYHLADGDGGYMLKALS